MGMNLPVKTESLLRRFFVRDFSSNRSWDLDVEGGRLSVRAGAPGTPGETEQFDCPSEDEALKAAAARVSKALGADVQAFEDGLAIYQYDFGAQLVELGCKGNKVMLRYSDVEGRSSDPRETRWARFESPRVAKATEAALRQFVNQAVDEQRAPDLRALTELLAPPAQVPDCPCSECARLLREGARSPSMSSSSVELSLTEHSTPVIVAGKQLAVGVTTDVLRELCERVDAFAKKEGLKVALVSQSPPTWPPEQVLGRALVIGQVVAVGNHHDLTELPVAALRKGLEAARKLPWKKLMPLLEDDGLQSPQGLEWECPAEPDDEVQLRVFGTGVMASGMVGFGVPRPDCGADGQEEGEADASDGELEEVWGQDMNQKRLPRLVYGQYAGVCDFHDNDGPGIVDVSPQAHKKRTAALGSLGKKAGYYLIGRYD